MIVENRCNYWTYRVNACDTITNMIYNLPNNLLITADGMVSSVGLIPNAMGTGISRA